MDSIKKPFREAEKNVKEAGREVDGHDVRDDLGNIGDEIKTRVGNAGDDFRAGVRNVERDADREMDRNQPN